MVRGEEPVWYLWKKTWQFSKGNRRNVVLYISLSVIANLFSFIQPLVMAKLLNTIQIEGVSHANLAKLLLITSLLVLSVVGFWAFHAPSRVLERKNAFYVRSRYKKYLVDGVLAMPPQWHSEHHSGDTIDKIEKGTGGMSAFAGGTFEVIETIIRFVGSTIALLYFNLVSGFLVIFFVFLAVMIVLRYDKRIKAQLKEINKMENATSQKVFDFISNITTVIILRIEKLASSEIWQKINAPYQIFKRNVVRVEVKWALVSLVSALMTFSVIAAYLAKEAFGTGVVLVGTLVALSGYVDRISGLFFKFAYKYGDILSQKVNVENAEELAKDFQSRCAVEQIKMDVWRELSIEGLTFSYHSGKGEKREQLHLSNVSMKIRRGEKIALIGESGSGKTTFLKMVRGLYAPQSVRINLHNGKPKPEDIGDFNCLSDAISLIPQEPELFTATVRENITMGIEVSEAALKKYMDAACFTDVVERLPRKLSSNIKEKGVNLSGGEKQRLALARGLLASKDKQIIMLDEPTSSVDSRNEMKIYENIFEMYRGKTIMSSIHRLHLLPLFDKIYMFEKGEIIASGNLQELLENSPQFRKLWEKYHRAQKREENIDAT